MRGTVLVRSYARFLIGFLFLGIISGCAVRSYTVTKDRADQERSGNQGYLKGKSPLPQTPPQKTTRTLHVVEVDMGPQKEATKTKTTFPLVKPAVSRGAYMYEEPLYPGEKVSGEEVTEVKIAVPGTSASSGDSVTTYTVKKGDTLEKIAARDEIYGSSKKWKKIYEANKEKMKSPDRIYPGQVLVIPRD